MLDCDWSSDVCSSDLRASTLADAGASSPRDNAAPEPVRDAAGRVGWHHPDGLHVAIGRGALLRPPPDLALAARRAAAEVELRAFGSDARAQALAAWWAGAYGDLDLARHLVPGPLSGPYEDVRVATLVFLGEPVRPVGPLSRAVAGGPAEPATCPPPFVPWPGAPVATADANR
jgi:hypothetical protein